MEPFEHTLPDKPSEAAIGVAARCWCDKETSDRVMDDKLAMAFAKRIDALMTIATLYAKAIPPKEKE